MEVVRVRSVNHGIFRGIRSSKHGDVERFRRMAKDGTEPEVTEKSINNLGSFLPHFGALLEIRSHYLLLAKSFYKLGNQLSCIFNCEAKQDRLTHIILNSKFLIVFHSNLNH